MRRIHYWFVLIVGIALIVSSCAKKDDSSSTTTTEVEGTWITNCYEHEPGYYIDTLIVSGTDVTHKSELHTDSSCSTDNGTWINTYSSLSIGDSVTFESGSTGHYFSIAISTFTYTPNLASDVTTMNDDAWCGFSDWTINTQAKHVVLLVFLLQIQLCLVCICLLAITYSWVIFLQMVIILLLFTLQFH